jgi:dCMP deaminase
MIVIKREHRYDEKRCVKCGVERYQPFPLSDDKCRPSWHEVWMKFALNVSERSCDPRLKVGCVIVTEDNSQVLSIGYNGSFKGGPNYPESLEPGKSGLLHAELNALIKCDYNHHKKKIMYVTHSPCLECAKNIINASIDKVIYLTEYRSLKGVELLHNNGVNISTIHDAVLDET